MAMRQPALRNLPKSIDRSLNPPVALAEKGTLPAWDVGSNQ
jgi:hypothetical protein